MTVEEINNWLRLLITPAIGIVTAKKLLQVFGLPQHIFSKSQAQLCTVVSQQQANNLLRIPVDLEKQLSLTLDWLEKDKNRAIVTLADESYPISLLSIVDPPILLFMQGVDLSAVVLAKPSLAMVGSRSPTPQGIENSLRFSEYFARQGITIVSGLAVGIDGAAHHGALKADNSSRVQTIAVLGTGLDKIYPKQHQQLARQITESGILISEFVLGTEPIGYNFPKRNRLIAGLSAGVLVVEASMRSGSLLTAKQAIEQGKEVFAIPGSIHSLQSRGCNSLIKQGAKLVETAQDVFEEMKPQWGRFEVANAVKSNKVNTVDAEQLKILDCLSNEPVAIESLSNITGVSSIKLQSMLLELELSGEIERAVGGCYQKITKQ